MKGILFFRCPRSRGWQFNIIFVCFFATQAFGQNDPTNYIRTDLIGASPNASSLGAQGEVPLTYYTGLPNISIPVYTVQGRELSLPISLSYHFQGFRPSEVSGWAGLGWTLNAGGVITRNVRDKVDELGSSAGTFDTIQNILNLADSDGPLWTMRSLRRWWTPNLTSTVFPWADTLESLSVTGARYTCCPMRRSESRGTPPRDLR